MEVVWGQGYEGELVDYPRMCQLKSLASSNSPFSVALGACAVKDSYPIMECMYVCAHMLVHVTCVCMCVHMHIYMLVHVT